MATIIFDLDDTLYNTQKFKDDMHAVLTSHRITHEDILDSYKEARAGHNYSFDKHLDILAKTYEHIETEKELILQKLKDLLLNIYTYPKVTDYLKELKKSHTLILLTTGKESAQVAKIDRAGIKEFFHRICITQEEKHQFLKNLNLEGPVYVVNDKADENQMIRETLPHFTILEMKNGEPILFDSP
jgi:FMN phosphatase YigB (HAD superfamily)